MTSIDHQPHFDIPVTYNKKVQTWIKYFQGNGRRWFESRLERSYRYLPLMHRHLQKKQLPRDLAYISLIESGFSAHAVSSAAAVGYWQFIGPTAKRYGLQQTWWLDERRDFVKSTKAAANYLSDLYKIFRSWHLTAAAYNMGEGRLLKLISRHNTMDFWVLSSKKDFPKETREYIPKLIAAVLIAKMPKLYGFKNLSPMQPYSYEYVYARGGTDLKNLASHLDISHKELKRLNPSLKHGFIPSKIQGYWIRIPKGKVTQVSQYMKRVST
ncbi:MAG: murein transglycosylase [Bdellovibrionaceae bacterium]|nr:murein transglycosylase [Pseudobdellovibrionaceae bacterium]